MQGKIWVESAPGTGSSFCFTESFGVASEEQLPSAPPPTAPLEQKRVLVVDDNATNRWILVEAIRAEPTSAALPIILLSSGAESVAEAAAQSLRVCALLTKPVLREDLAQAIRIALGAVSEAPRAARAITPHRSLHILLADDNPVNRGVGVRLMHSRRHTVLAVENGAEALAALEAERFDVVLMDVEMPEMDGFEATILQRERERGTGRRVPIVALTAHAMSGDRERCLAAGMDDYVTNPIRARELFAVFYALTGDASARDAAA